MSFLRSLFARPHPPRHFALLDAEGYCRALRQSQTAPETGNWVEVVESRLSWLDTPLPADARATPVVANAKPAQPLAA